VLYSTVYLGSLLIKELKRIVETSDITKYVFASSFFRTTLKIADALEPGCWVEETMGGGKEYELQAGRGGQGGGRTERWERLCVERRSSREVGCEGIPRGIRGSVRRGKDRNERANLDVLRGAGFT
jgi:hypothetical protein